jgi:hypothetical protein
VARPRELSRPPSPPSPEEPQQNIALCATTSVYPVLTGRDTARTYIRVWTSMAPPVIHSVTTAAHVSIIYQPLWSLPLHAPFDGPFGGVHHCRPVHVHRCSSLFIVVHRCSSLFIVVHRLLIVCSSLFIVCSSLLIVVHRCSSFAHRCSSFAHRLFIVVHRCSSLPARCAPLTVQRLFPLLPITQRLFFVESNALSKHG